MLYKIIKIIYSFDHIILKKKFWFIKGSFESEKPTENPIFLFGVDTLK